jgi:MtrB/PioB family decaheme-associated outer membrane protein
MQPNTSWLMILTLAGAVSVADAQTPTGPASEVLAPLSPRARQIDFGARLTGISGDPARVQRFRDLRDGATVELFRFGSENTTWGANLEADHVGFRDQHYFASFDRFGKLQASFDWDQIPLFYSEDTKTLYTETSPGVFRLDDSLQAAIQNKTATLPQFAGQAGQFELRQRRDIAQVNLAYNATQNLNLTMDFTSHHRGGATPFGASFGFSDAIEQDVPVDHRTNNLAAQLEWADPKGMFQVGYDGSWFNNDVETLVWDNPLRITDQTTANAYSTGEGSSQGRTALWPDNKANTVHAAGSIRLPAHSQAFGYVSFGQWDQNEALLPYTINTAIPPIPLDRTTAEAQARIIAMNYRFTTRPAQSVWLTAQFKRYDFDNRTPEFNIVRYVRFDGTVSPSVLGHTEAFGYVRNFVDVDASFTPIPFGAIRVGYGRETDDRTFRYIDRTNEDTFRVAFDTLGASWASVRVQYDHSRRRGEGFDEEALDEIGEQVSLRQFDISDRDRDRITALLQITPIERVGVNASIGYGSDKRPNAEFGLQHNNSNTYTVGADAVPNDNVSFGAQYGYETYSTLQNSRQASPGPQFDDPTRNWATDYDEGVHTLSAYAILKKIAPRTGVRVSYELSDSKATYIYVLPPNSTIRPAPQQLTPVRNQLYRGIAEVRYAIVSDVTLGLGYWYERYDVEDFAFSPATLNSPTIPAFTNLTYWYRPYTANTGFVRLIYVW